MLLGKFTPFDSKNVNERRKLWNINLWKLHHSNALATPCTIVAKTNGAVLPKSLHSWDIFIFKGQENGKRINFYGHRRDKGKTKKGWTKWNQQLKVYFRIILWIKITSSRNVLLHLTETTLRGTLHSIIERYKL